MRAVREHLIVSAIPEARWIAHKLARRYRRVEEDDLVSAGMIGLMKAEARFEERRGLLFVTFAKVWIWGEMMEHVRSEGPLSNEELALRRKDPARAAQAVKYHTRRVFNYEDVLQGVASDVGQLEARIKEHDRERVLRGMTEGRERMIRMRLAGRRAAEIGRELGVSESRVVQIQRLAEKEIRALMTEEELVPADLI